MTSNNTEKPWGGRFTAPTDKFVEQFTESVSYDQRLAHYDIIGSIAHVRMLAKVDVITKQESAQIVSELEKIEIDINSGQFQWSIALEDVHMNIETALVHRIGDVGKKLHTGRSRNDQIATDIRLYLRDEIVLIGEEINAVINTLLTLASEHTDTIMPGFTHLQSAQPVTFGHHLLAWAEMLLRDRSRLQDCRKRLNVLPLGAAALAGTSYPIDREYVAEILGFDGITQNSLDSVSDRDFAIEFSACASLIMMHLSRFSEELITWISQANGFIDLGDAWCTGSSIMPQKKNPDIPELVRGKTGRVYGDLLALLTLMKGQPLAYNRDNQEDKECLFDAIDTVKMCLMAYAGLIPTITVNREAMYQAAADGYATATDLADYLVVNGLPFRDAHAVVGKTVQFAIQQDKSLSSLTLPELQQFSDVIKDDVFAVLELEGSVSARNHIGGTAPEQVKEAIARLKKQI
ncbi:MAG: argininosuccinate lyase [Proteobacteria bacterium]|nr:argininosuccinate lyase [Pseudomonadota bacterium]